LVARSKLLGAAAVLLLSVGAAAAAPAVSRQDLNVRSGPGTGYGVVGVIQAGATVDVGACQGSWCQVAFDGGSGYANRSYLQMANAPSAGLWCRRRPMIRTTTITTMATATVRA
jgi:uncharacterized protein YraI